MEKESLKHKKGNSEIEIGSTNQEEGSPSIWQSLLTLLMLIFGIGLLGNFVSMGVWSASGNDMTELMQADSLSLTERFWFRAGMIINHATMFLIPALVYGYIYHRDRFLRYLKLNITPTLHSVSLWGLVILFSYPIIAYLTQLNDKIPLPDWAVSGQEDAFRILGNVLQMDNIWELLMTLILVGILPALGEEFIFRGIVQQRLSKYFSSPFTAILVASLLFGLTHMQLERIFPLAFLGMIMGLSYYFTKSLVVPIILHFCNNAFQVISLYAVGDVSQEQIANVPDLPFYVVILSFILTFGALYFAMVSSQKEHLPFQKENELRP